MLRFVNCFMAIAFLIYVGVRIIARFVLPFLGKYFIKKATENIQEKARTQREGEKVYQDGEVTIRKQQTRSARDASSDEGDYVEYEEVE